jgi:hypothetical protein
VITVAELSLHTVKDLAEMAKKKGIPRWHAMRKQELIQALVEVARKEARQKKNRLKKAATSSGRKAKAGSSSKTSGSNGKPQKSSARKTTLKIESSSTSKRSKVSQKAPQKTSVVKKTVAAAPPSPELQKNLRQWQEELIDTKDLAATSNGETTPAKDRLILMVRDPYWLQAYWEISRQSVERARVALSQNWYLAKPLLRLWEVRRDGTSHSERVFVKDIEIHGRVNNWYINVDNPPRSFEVDIGYATPDRKFFCLARSNIVSTPHAATTGNELDWSALADEFERIYALSGGYDDTTDTTELREVLEDRLRRPLGGSVIQRLGAGVEGQAEARTNFRFFVDAELVVFGQIQPGYHVSIRGEPVTVCADGTFSIRLPLPDRRHVLPIVGQSPDGTEQRTVVLAVERNTKIMEPLHKDHEPAA